MIHNETLVATEFTLYSLNGKTKWRLRNCAIHGLGQLSRTTGWHIKWPAEVAASDTCAIIITQKLSKLAVSLLMPEYIHSITNHPSCCP